MEFMMSSAIFFGAFFNSLERPIARGVEASPKASSLGISISIVG